LSDSLNNVLTSDYPSHVAVRHSGSVDTYLWHELNRAVYIPCFAGKISVEPVRDLITKKLISGPIVCKTDGGPGRLSKEAESIDFREEMAAMGVHILLSLPNGTAATAEMDQLYSKFKPRCKDSTIRVAGAKMVKRSAARKKHAEETKIKPAKGWTVWRRVVRATARLLARRRVGGVHAI